MEAIPARPLAWRLAHESGLLTTQLLVSQTGNAECMDDVRHRFLAGRHVTRRVSAEEEVGVVGLVAGGEPGDVPSLEGEP